MGLDEGQIASIVDGVMNTSANHGGDTTDEKVERAVRETIAALRAGQEPAKQRYDAAMLDGEEPDPVERLRFFCSLAMNGHDWIDVEPFFDALASAPPSGYVAVPVKSLLEIRDAIVKGDTDEAFHQLYFAVPWKDPFEPWAEWEAMLLAASRPQS